MSSVSHFIDANIFIRHLTQDHPRFSSACTALLARAERGELIVTTSESVVTEVVQVLGSPRLYRLPRQKISILLTALLSLPGMKCPGGPYIFGRSPFMPERILIFRIA